MSRWKQNPNPVEQPFEPYGHEADQDWRGPYGAIGAEDRIGNHYADSHGAVNPDLDAKVGDMYTQKERLAVLSGLRQNADAMSNGWAECAATSVMGAAIYGGGEIGLSQLIDATEKYELGQEAKAKKEGKKSIGDEKVDMAEAERKAKAGLESELSPAEVRALDFKRMDDIKKKIHDGEPLTNADLQGLQHGLYDTLNHYQHAAATGDAAAEAGAGGVNMGVIADFIQQSPDMAKMFKEKDMHIEDVRLGGGASHAVLGIGSIEGKGESYRDLYYDPQARVQKEVTADGDRVEKKEDGHAVMDSQLVTDWRGLMDYHDITRNEVDAEGWHSPGGHAPKPGERKKSPFG